jgi:FkbM family methyltransferase
VRIRRGTWDEAFVARVIEHREYNPPGYEIQPGDTVVDVGANVGTFALLASRAAGPSGRVIACEPDSENFALLLRNLRDNRCVNVIPAKVAVAGTAGKLTLHSGGQGGFHSLYAARLPGSPRSCEVEALTLADVFERFGVGRCDFLKVDCEGAEFEIFPALPEGHWPRILRLAMEYHGIDADHTQDKPRGDALAALFEARGLRVEVREEFQPPFRGGHLWARRP